MSDEPLTQATPTTVDGKLRAALHAVQSQIPIMTKTQTANTGSYTYAYADLATIWQLVQPLLAAQGLFVLQPAALGPDGTVIVTTRIIHVEGGEVMSQLAMPYHGNSPQAVGSAIAYARRYGLCSLLSIVAETDDDAQKAEGPRAKQAAAPRPQPRPDAAPARPSAAVTVESVDRTETRTGLDRWVVTFSDGKALSTLSEQMGPRAEQLAGTGVEVIYTVSRRGKYENLQSLTEAGDTNQAPDVDPDDEGPPF